MGAATRRGLFGLFLGAAAAPAAASGAAEAREAERSRAFYEAISAQLSAAPPLPFSLLVRLSSAPNREALAELLERHA